MLKKVAFTMYPVANMQRARAVMLDSEGNAVTLHQLKKPH